MMSPHIQALHVLHVACMHGFYESGTCMALHMAMEVEEQIRHIHVFLCTYIYNYIYNYI